MAVHEVEVAIIGAGTAGLAAFRAARDHVERVALIEGGPHGTTCARVGCMPSKLLIAAADAAQGVRHAPVFGVQTEEPQIDGPAVLERVRRYRDRFVSHVLNAVEGIPEELRLRGPARFLNPHRLAVGDDVEVRAGRIVIATGSTPHVVDQLVGAGERLITSDDAFELEDLPASMAVFGAGVVGLELVQALQRLGVRVRLFGHGGLVGPLTDPDVLAYACRTLQDAYPFHPDAEVKEVRQVGDGVEVTWNREGSRTSECFAWVLAATGRRPALAGLDLERAGLNLDDKGTPLFERTTGQCSGSHIFIAGDADGELPLLHEAADDGRIAGENAARFPEVRVRPRRAPLTIVFTRPEIALVGRSHRELEESGTAFRCGAVSYEDQGRAVVQDEARGLVRVYGEYGSGRFLGAEMVAPAAEHLAHLLAWAAQRQLTVSEILDLPFYHPTLEEGLRTALRELRRNLQMGPEPVSRCLDCGPGG